MSTLVVDHPLVTHKLALLRDRNTRVPEFRRTLNELGALLAYEALRDVPVEKRHVVTPLATTITSALAMPYPAVVSVLRAGNGLLDGFLAVLPEAAVGYVGLVRDHETHRPTSYYLNLPDSLGQRAVYVVDPMLATGHSAVAALERVKAAGATQITLVCVIAAPEGVAVVEQAHPDVRLVIGAVDEGLNDAAYIVPGLGDAGDRQFGTAGHG
jgi:uracil phosphoribosyltransferase